MSRVFSLLGSQYSPEDFITLCSELNLLPLFLRRFIERKYSSDFIPSEDQQIAYQKNFLIREHIDSVDDLNFWLQRNDITEIQLSKQLFHSLQLTLFKANKFQSEVEPLFLDSKSKLDQVMYSLIRCSERAKANEIFMRLSDEESTFASLASQYSEGYEQQVNGLIGPMEIGRINPAIAERLRISKEGQVWEPFKEQEWWVILRLEKLIPSRLDADMRVRLIDVLYEEWIKNQVLSEMQSLSDSPLFVDSVVSGFKSIPQESESNSTTIFQKVIHKVFKSSNS